MATKKSVVKTFVAQSTFALACEHLGVPAKDGVYIVKDGVAAPARKFNINPSPRVGTFIHSTPIKAQHRWISNARSVNALLPVAAYAWGEDKSSYIAFVDGNRVSMIFCGTFVIAGAVVEGAQVGGYKPVLEKYGVKLDDLHGLTIYKPASQTEHDDAPKGDAPATDLKSLFEAAFAKPAKTAKPAK